MCDRVGSGHVSPRIWEITFKLSKGGVDQEGILSVLSLRECRMCCHQNKPGTIGCSAAMSSGNIVQTPKKTY